MRNDDATGRREFVRRATSGIALLGSRPLWGWSGYRKSGAPADARPKAAWVAIPTREHYGDVEERLQIPRSWDLTTHRMAGHAAPVLSRDEIRRRVEAPIGSQRLADIARGKRTAVITFDDLTRPTPTSDVLFAVIDELKAGGIRDEGILFLTSYGSHRPLMQEEAQLKIGAENALRYPWENHNIFDNLVDVGRTSRGNRIKINPHFRQADLRVTLSGIKIHGTAGFGGGAKAVLPGVACIESISYFHQTIAGKGNRTVGPFKIFKNECRLDMVEAARLAQVEFSVQILYNGYRKVTGVYAGDVVDAHHAACREALGRNRTEVARGVDLVIANGYPQNAQATSSLRWASAGLRDGGTAVLVIQSPMGMETLHFAGERASGAPRFEEAARPAKSSVPQAAQLIVYSSYLQMRDMVKFPASTVFTRTWADTVAAIGKVHRGDLKAALYPYAAIQHPPGELDG